MGCNLHGFRFSFLSPPQMRRGRISTLGLFCKWTILLISSRLSISSNAFSSRSGLLGVFCSFLLFAEGYCEASVTIHCWGLYDGKGSGSCYDYQYATADGGGLGGYSGCVQMWPFLANYRNAPLSNGYIFWPAKYSTSSDSPVAYAPKEITSRKIVVSNDHTNRLNDIINTISSYGDGAWDQRACISGISVSYSQDGTPEISFSTYPPGTLVGNGVSTYDSSGNSIISYTDSTGYAPGYTYSPEGVFVPCWWDLSSGSPVMLSSLRDVSSNNLTYDSTTGLYSFTQYDYSAQLAQISETLSDINSKETTVTIDNIDLTVPAPEVTVNVPAPEVTVNVTAPTQNDITVAIDDSYNVEMISAFSEAIQADQYSTYQQLSNLNSNFNDVSTSDFTLDPVSYTTEEQQLITMAQGWNTQIPVISNVVDCAFNTFLGSIPDPGRDLHPISGLTFLGFDIDIDFRPYGNLFIPFRAFLLMLEVVWFVNSVWKTVNQSLQV